MRRRLILVIGVLVVVPLVDRLVDVSGADLKSVLPKAEVVVLPDVGHIPMVEEPEKSAKAFLRFRGVAS